jgi:mycobactin lysine-N-oxygenase
MSGAVADLLVVGAGAKAAAVAAKVHCINTLGLGPITLTIVEANEHAASWQGLNGMTSGDEGLAITPMKDVGFPYESAGAFGELGDAIDSAMLAFTWQAYLVGGRRWSRWINADLPGIRHRDYGIYLAWVHSQATAGVRHVHGRVDRIELEEDRWAAEVTTAEGARRLGGRALLLTGSGVHRELPHDPKIAARVYHCDDRRPDLAAAIPVDRRTEVAIVGGGEGALSCAMFLRQQRPNARLTIHTPSLPMSRGEGFLENRAFSNPDSINWSALDLATRRAFVQRCDRGVFGPDGQLTLAYDDHCRFVTGRVVHLGPDSDGRGVRLECDTIEGPWQERYDLVVNCTGFDLLEQVRGLFPEEVRAAIERQAGPLWHLSPEEELRFGRALEVAGMRPRLHIPGLAGISQGPGFANLGCLGLLADRVVAPLLMGDDGVVEPSLEPGAAVAAHLR